jgi:hypothetical protein
MGLSPWSAPLLREHWHALALTPAEFGKFIAAETGKWAKVVKCSGAKPD